jgi:prepilin-type N-terminal cleavage/methylation domain-containing protein
MSTRARTRRAAGFTLIELMVSLTIGGLAIGSMYSIGSTLTRHYHQQQQSANAMTSLRVAIEQVKRDIARAGYLATPNIGPAAPHTSLGCEPPLAYPYHTPGSTGFASPCSATTRPEPSTRTSRS